MNAKKNIEKKTSYHRSLLGLDWLNFFLSDVQAGFGPFLAIYLASYEWNEQLVGLALTTGSLSQIITQTPAGALVDYSKSKRAIIGFGVIILALCSFFIAIFPNFWPILIAQTLIGSTSSLFIPAVCAISLGIVGQQSFDARQGRNQMFNSAGNVFAAVLMGAIAYYISNQAIFFLIILFTIPVIFSLLLIDPNDINYEQARGENNQRNENKIARFSDLLKDKPLIIFLICAVLFHFANAAMLPLLGEMLAKGKGKSSMLFMSLCVITTQFVIALIASWSGKKASEWGRKPLLLIAFGVLPIRGLLYTFTTDPMWLVSIQILDGIGAGLFGVISILVIADLTQGTGRFNFTIGAISCAVGIGASLSQVIAGSIVHYYSFTTGFIFLSSIAVLAFIVLYFFMPETLNKK